MFLQHQLLIYKLCQKCQNSAEKKHFNTSENKHNCSQDYALVGETISAHSFDMLHEESLLSILQVPFLSVLSPTTCTLLSARALSPLKQDNSNATQPGQAQEQSFVVFLVNNKQQNIFFVVLSNKKKFQQLFHSKVCVQKLYLIYVSGCCSDF